MFDLRVMGEKNMRIAIKPAVILGHEIEGFEDCYFYSRIPAEDIKLV